MRAGADAKPVASRHWYAVKPKRSYSGASQPRAKAGSRPGSARSGRRSPAWANAWPAASASTARRSHERAGLHAHHRQDPARHEILVPAGKLSAGVRGERPQGEAEELVDVEGAGGVLLVVGAVLRLVGLALEHAAVDQELAPLVVAVTREERVIEVEQGQPHGPRVY